MAADLNNHTADGYLSALERLMIIEDQPAWAPHLRIEVAAARRSQAPLTSTLLSR